MLSVLDLEGVNMGKGSEGSSSNSLLVVCTGTAKGSGHVLAGLGEGVSTCPDGVLVASLSFQDFPGVRRGVSDFLRENGRSYVGIYRQINIYMHFADALIQND